ncbi:retrovirus-related pol polyprotein from transposon TNT 1-94 [Tanacetum coccineum]
MLAPKCSTYNGRPTFANPRYLKKAQSEKPCLYEIPYDNSDHANRFAPNREETMTLANESRSKLNKDYVKPYDYTKQNNVTCSYLHSLSDLNAYAELQCMYLHKVKECECLAQKLSKQTESVNKEVHNKLLKSFAKLENHSISLELTLQQCKEQMKNNSVCKENGSNVFRKEREQYHEIQDLKAQMQDKNIAIRVNHYTSVSRPQLKSYQVKDKVVPNNSQVKFNHKEVEEHHRISSISRKTNLYLNDMNARTKKPKVVPISASKPKRKANKSVATPHKKTIVQLILFIVDSGCTKHMTGYLKLLSESRKITIKRLITSNALITIYSRLSIICDADLEVAFRKSTCFVRDLQGNDLLTGNRGSDLYTISLQETTSSTPICFMAKASPTQAWLWHRRLSHLNFDYITLLSKKDIVTGLPKLKYVKDQLCSSCEMSKAKRSSFKSKVVPSSKGRLNLLHMDLCGPMRVASINGKKYILVIVDDYSRYTWTLFLRSKDETPEVLKDFLTMIQPQSSKHSYKCP